MKQKTTLINLIYIVTLSFITLSGFAQMPIFKRYYIADIPGLGWLAQFYVTHIIHYGFAILLITLATYAVFDYFLNKVLNKDRRERISGIAYIKVVTISGLIISGALMVVRNLPGVFFDHIMIISLDLTHLSLCMMLLVVSLYSWVKKKPWYNR